MTLTSAGTDALLGPTPPASPVPAIRSIRPITASSSACRS